MGEDGRRLPAAAGAPHDDLFTAGDGHQDPLGTQFGDAIGLVEQVQHIIDDASANAGKTDEQTVASVMSFKTSLRQAQADYFATRDGAV